MPPISAIRLALAIFAVASFSTSQADEAGSAHSMAMEHHASHRNNFSFGQPSEARLAQRTVAITMEDMSFEPKVVTVKPGEIVRFVIANSSAIDHEFTIGDKTSQQAHRLEMAAMAKIPGMGSMHHHDANAVSVSAHETKEVTWKFGQAAQLEYDCNIPGHFEAGMTGALIVQ